MTDRKHSTVSKILSYQVLIILIITAGFAFAGGWQQGLSSALGGVAAFIPNLYFALRIVQILREAGTKNCKLLLCGRVRQIVINSGSVHNDF